MAPQIAATSDPRAQAALATSPVFALRDLKVERAADSLVITGVVNSFYHKQLAQEVVRTVSAGLTVVNSVEVQWSPDE